MKTNPKPANRFHRPAAAIIRCLGPILIASTLASCGTGPSGMTASAPVSLRSEYQLKSWRDSQDPIRRGDSAGRSLQSSGGTWVISENPLIHHELIHHELILVDSKGSTRESEDSMNLYSHVARETELTSRLLLAADESTPVWDIERSGEGFWPEQASR